MYFRSLTLYVTFVQIFVSFSCVPQIIEECENRFGDAIEELVELVENVLPPPPPTQPETIAEGKEETAITKQSNEGMDVVNE